jgi:hypothetical protein
MHKKLYKQARYRPIIPPTQEADIKRISVQGQLEQKVSETSYQQTS